MFHLSSGLILIFSWNLLLAILKAVLRSHPQELKGLFIRGQGNDRQFGRTRIYLAEVSLNTKGEERGYLKGEEGERNKYDYN